MKISDTLLYISELNAILSPIRHSDNDHFYHTFAKEIFLCNHQAFGTCVASRWQSSCDALEINWMDRMARYGSERSLHSLQPMHPGHSTYVAGSTSPTTPTTTTCSINLTKVATTISSIHVPSVGSPDSPSKSMEKSVRDFN